MFLKEKIEHEHYTWASGSDDRGNSIPRIDVNNTLFFKNEFKLGSNLSKRDGLNTSRHYETLVAKL